MNIDYDIIGLSYYPYFHGDMSVLDNALASLQTNYPDKKIMILETGYSYKWEQVSCCLGRYTDRVWLNRRDKARVCR